MADDPAQAPSDGGPLVTEPHASIAGEAEDRDARRAMRERRWRPLFIIVLTILLLSILFAPAPTLERKLLLTLSGVCSQQHNLTIGGVQLPLCARDSGMYLSLLATLAVIVAAGRTRAAALPPRPILATLIALALIMAIDGVNSTVNEIGLVPWYAPRNDLRALTGMGAGIGLAMVLTLLVNMSLRRNPAEALPVLGHWRELGAIAFIDLLLLATLLLDVAVLAWPLTLLVFAGVTGALFVTALVALAVMMRYDGAISHPFQLARPATLALLLTGGFLAGMALLRAWLVGSAPML